MAGEITSHVLRGWRTAPLLAGLMAVVAHAAATPAAAAWHADLPTARTASAASQKPVFVVFTAAWSPESTAFEQQVLSAGEAEAVIAACFEPVRVDVDQRPGLTKRLQVAHVPSACVLGAGDTVLTRFDCPPTTAAFVAAVARAAQQAAASRPAGDVAGASTSPHVDRRDPPDLATSGFATTPGDGSPLPASGSRDAAASGSISLVTAKVRKLSDFATTSSPQAPVATTSAPAVASTEPSPSRFVSATPIDPPALPRTPPTWPAESSPPAATFTNAPPQPAPATSPRSIEPSQAAATPWLAGGAVPPTEPESSATASDLTDKKKQTSTWSSFVAAFQKPFNVFSKPAKEADPPTLPPARSTSPLTPTQELAATATVSAPAAPDPYGSMPLGLEGYCPVTLAERGVWTEGRAQWGARHRGRTYLFAGPEQQQAFLTSPDRYAPALSGDDPVLAVDQGKVAPGRRAYGVTYQSRMYLFSSQETRAQFAANPERYTAPVMLAERPAPVDATRRY